MVDLVTDKGSKEANEKHPKKGALGKYKWYIVGGLAVIAVLVFYFTRSSNANNNASTATNPNQTGIDPTTGVPYASEYGSGGSYGFPGSAGATGPAGPAGPAGKRGPRGPRGNPPKSKKKVKHPVHVPKTTVTHNTITRQPVRSTPVARIPSITVVGTGSHPAVRNAIATRHNTAKARSARPARPAARPANRKA